MNRKLKKKKEKRKKTTQLNRCLIKNICILGLFKVGLGKMTMRSHIKVGWKIKRRVKHISSRPVILYQVVTIAIMKSSSDDH